MHPTSGTDTAAPHAPARSARHRRAAARAVFLDASGRRQRRVRRIGRLLVIPAVGYVALLLSTAFGGPTVSSPYLPLPEAGDHRPGAASPGPAATTTKADGKPAAATERRTPGSGSSPGGSTTAPPVPVAAPGVSLSPSASPGTPQPTATPTATASRGKSTATHPVPTHTTRGHG